MIIIRYIIFVKYPFFSKKKANFFKTDLTGDFSQKERQIENYDLPFDIN